MNSATTMFLLTKANRISDRTIYVSLFAYNCQHTTSRRRIVIIKNINVCVYVSCCWCVSECFSADSFFSTKLNCVWHSGFKLIRGGCKFPITLLNTLFRNDCVRINIKKITHRILYIMVWMRMRPSPRNSTRNARCVVVAIVVFRECLRYSYEHTSKFCVCSSWLVLRQTLSINSRL